MQHRFTMIATIVVMVLLSISDTFGQVDSFMIKVMITLRSLSDKGSIKTLVQTLRSEVNFEGAVPLLDAKSGLKHCAILFPTVVSYALKFQHGLTSGVVSAGDAYLGTQGDVWDAQMDMSCAAIGAVICMTTTALMRKMLRKGPELLVGGKANP